MITKVLIFLVMVVACFFVFRINPFAPLKKLHTWRPKKKDKNYTVKSYLTKIGGSQKENIVQKSLKETRSSLYTIGQENRYKQTTRFAFVVGVTLGILSFLMFRSPLVSIVIAVGGGMVPLWVTKLSVYAHNESVNDELETALSMITVTYSRTENIVSAIEEAVPHANFPVKGVLQNFLRTVHNISFDVPTAIAHMKNELDNVLFHEWCNVLILCQDDASLVAGLHPIISKISHIKQQQLENKTQMMAPMKQTITMIIVTCSVIPILLLVNPEWYAYLVGTVAGQVVMAIVAVIIFASIHKAINLSRPVEHKL